MKRTIRISGSVSGTIATGSFQNLKPTFTWEEEIEMDATETLDDDKIQKRRQFLYDMSFSLLKQAEDRAIVERINREREDLRFITNPKTKKVSPSTTSVINFDFDFYCSPEDLRQYASQSNVTHERVTQYIKTGIWVPPESLEDIWADILILKKGSLALSLDAGNFPAFLEKYSIDNMKIVERMFDEKEDSYNGEFDFTGIPHWKGAEEIPTVFDVKRSKEKIKNGMQLAAYCKLAGYKQGIIVPLNSKTEQGHSRPVVYNEKQLEGYYKIFLQKRKDFKKRYGV
jgi:hypothetical protein